MHYAALTGHKLALEMLLDTSTELLSRVGPNPPTTALHIAVRSRNDQSFQNNNRNEFDDFLLGV